MRPRDLFLVIGLVLLGSTPIQAEPYSASCGAALEKLLKARTVLIPFQPAMERARIHERVAMGETLTCVPGGINYSVQQAQRCSQATSEAPQRIKETFEDEDVYLQWRQVFVEQLERAKQDCLLEP